MKSFFAILAIFLSFTLLTLSSPLPEKTGRSASVKFDGKVKGFVKFLENKEKQSTTVTVKIFSGLTNLTGLYPYHIHQHPVPESGNCTLAGAHLSPNGYPDGAPCDPATAYACQEGDLSGKHGKLPGSKNVVFRQYEDPFLQWDDPNATIRGRSVVIHYPNGKY
ncbi:8942_t:CDS:2 [Paraglomus occultum]|uniref:8942_t:CDS:1 n=1 Tax=Paraglomus occultum TaxID=144539 RepID=A0A9N8YYB1_9GLOM|nr:8942_t:CDS:2 [Paraglomus occultum]